MIAIRVAGPADLEAIWQIFRAVVQPGDTYPLATDTTRDEARALWFAPPAAPYVAADAEGAIVGTYVIKPNLSGGGRHVANASFMVAPARQGRGVGRTMAEHALESAREAGYLAMQFNFVVSTNARALALWGALGFTIVGTLPRAFRHPRCGLVDAYVMFRDL